MSQQTKQNNYPKKQGILYAISTGKNNGVYLPKDIAHDNHKSLSLLTNQAREAHRSYVNTLEFINKQPQNAMNTTKGLCEVENFQKNWLFFDKNLKILNNCSYELSISQKSLRQDFEKLNDRISVQNQQVLNSCTPALKTLRERIKLHKNQQSAIFSKIKRQIEHIEQSFELIQKGIHQCRKKMTVCEEIYGLEGQSHE